MEAKIMCAVKGYIQRKSMLYKTGVEYGDYTMNHVLGCSHGCKFPCYAYMMKKRFGQISSYEEWIEPHLVSNTLELLDKEIPIMFYHRSIYVWIRRHCYNEYSSNKEIK